MQRGVVDSLEHKLGSVESGWDGRAGRCTDCLWGFVMFLPVEVLVGFGELQHSVSGCETGREQGHQ